MHMKPRITRRSFLGVAGTGSVAVLASTAVAPAAEAASGPLVLGIACSPRPGKTTAQAVKAALEAVAAVSPGIRTELIDLGGRRIAGWSPTIEPDDFDAILPRLKQPGFAGMIMGSPSYFRSLSSLCKAFIERCMPLRDAPSPLADKWVGALGVAGNRNGGQELVVQQILTAMLSYGMLPVGGAAPSLLGGTVWNREGDDANRDEEGMRSARALGTRMGRLIAGVGKP